MLKVAAFTGGRKVPSARFRVRQHIQKLHSLGIAVHEMPALFGCYPPSAKPLRPFWAAATLAQRLPDIIRAYSYDVVLLQREFVSTFSTLEAMTKRPRVLDVDDAIYLLRGGNFARRLAQSTDHIICGNEYLATWFSDWNTNVRVIPTAVDTDHFRPPKFQRASTGAIIGWIGTSANLRYLLLIELALQEVLSTYPKVTLRIVCNQRPSFSSLNPRQIEFINWSEAGEVKSIQEMDIGIMPLEDSPWARGKCSFKMIQYMACGRPCVVSPVGSNATLLNMGDFALGAATNRQWADALIGLLEDERARAQMGSLGRQIALKSFSVQAIAPQIAEALRAV